MIFLCSYSQINVNSSGNVGVGISNPNKKMHVYGQMQVNPESWTGGFIFDNSYLSGSGYLPTLKPNTSWYGVLGTPSQYFGYSFIKQMRSLELLTEDLRSNTHINNYGYTFSDMKIKSGIKKIDNPFDLLMKLDGKKYDMLPPNIGLETDTDKKEEEAKKDEYGFIAQDFINVLPELVIFDSITGLYAINYTGLIPIIVEAMKEQQNTIEALEARIEKVEGSSKMKSATIDNTTTDNKENTLDGSPTLAQNIPNPFSSSTRIDITLPETVKNARLYVYNMQGAQIKSFDINERGNTSVTIEGYSLQAGMYLYTLIADGKEVDTKKMILTK